MRIAEAAEQLGVDTHVLRHWDAMGVVVPHRLPSGHRDYDANLVDRARLVQVCQAAGFSLTEIRELGHLTTPGRVDRLIARREQVRDQIRALRRAERLLTHVVTCTHPIISDCPDCSRIALEQKKIGRERSPSPR